MTSSVQSRWMSMVSLNTERDVLSGVSEHGI
jgi:hypothetical protein